MLTLRALGVYEGRQLWHGSVLSVFDALSALPKSIDLFPEILVPPYDTVMLVSATSVFLPKYTANCGSVAFLRLL